MVAKDLLKYGFYASRYSKDEFFKAEDAQLNNGFKIQFKTVNSQSKERTEENVCVAR